MASFIYEQFLRKQYSGAFSDPIQNISAFHLALVFNTYVPAPATDAFLSDIPGGDIAADGKTGTFPTFTFTINGSGAAPEAGYKLVIATSIWGTVAPSGSTPVNAVVLYATLPTGPTFNLVAYYDNWSGLPFVPNNTNVTLVSLPTPLQANGVNMVITASA